VSTLDNAVTLSGGMAASLLVGGTIRWLDGPYAGLAMGVVGNVDGALVLGAPLDQAIASGTRVLVMQGCDHTLTTCAQRFGNAINFRGEPFLPGNDLVVRYGLGQ
jgi:uncharacterized phage protein (TIGR02218 family)